MWIQGSEIIARWGVLPEELLSAFEKGKLVPWNRPENRHMKREDLIELSPDPLTFDWNREYPLRAIQKAFYKEDEASKYFHFAVTADLSYPEARTESDIEALKAALLKIEGQSWEKIAQALWPNVTYENGNSVHKKVERRLKRAKEILAKSISSVLS